MKHLTFLFHFIASFAIKITGLRLLYDSVWGQCKSLGFLHLLIPNPFIPSYRTQLLGLNGLRRGQGVLWVLALLALALRMMVSCCYVSQVDFKCMVGPLSSAVHYFFVLH